MKHSDILALLHREVMPAIGCTEPIAVALCVAKATEQLGALPEHIHVTLSKNVYKNAMSVGVPGTHMTGLPIAIACGAIAGKSEYQLEVLKDVNDEVVEQAKQYMKEVPALIEVDKNAPDVLYIHVEVEAQGKKAAACIEHEHTCFVEVHTARAAHAASPSEHMDDAKQSELTMREVYDYAMTAPIDDLRFMLDGAKMNKDAARLSFDGEYGLRLGKMLHDGKLDRMYGTTTFSRILSYTSAACDARMSGAMVPVMSNSGSGNQGISCSLPVLIYAEETKADEEQTIRALTLSNLTEIYIKQSLGRLSALCGCVVASSGSAVGICYLMGGGYEEICMAIKNMIANISGMLCDGAKPGCSLKVTSGVATAVLSASLAMQHASAGDDEGIVEHDIDRSIHNLTRIGREGMKMTDELIVDIMTHKQPSANQ